jgi:LysR family transcriptional regulator, transcriptional activator of the cysJI operon
MNFFPSINFLRYFYSSVKHKSMTRAAKENFVTQSAISQGIHKLEVELGKPLLSSRKNRLELTSEGELLLEKCENIFSELSNIEDLFNERADIYRGKLTFAASHSFALSRLQGYYKKLFEQYPAVEPVLRLGHAGIVRDWVSKGEVEFGIILAKEDDYSLFNTLPIFTGQNRLYKAKKGAKQHLNRLFISDQREDYLLLDHLRKEGKEIPPLIEVLSWEVIASMIEEGLGIGMLPDYVAQRHHLTPASITKFSITYSFIAISSKKKVLSRNAKMFIELMQI